MTPRWSLKERRAAECIGEVVEKLGFLSGRQGFSVLGGISPAFRTVEDLLPAIRRGDIFQEKREVIEANSPSVFRSMTAFAVLLEQSTMARIR